MKAFLSVLTLLLVSQFTEAKRNDDPHIFLRDSQTLYISINDNIYDLDNYNWGSETDRFHYIEETITELLEEIDFPIGYKIVRWGGNSVPMDEPELALSVHDWKYNRIGEIEVRLSAVLYLGQPEVSRKRIKNKLGFFRYAEGAFAMHSSSRAQEQYNAVLRKALQELMVKLNEHFGVEMQELEEPPFPEVEE